MTDIKELIKNIQVVIFDFDGVFTDNKVIVCENGTESVQCWRSDGLGLSRLKSIGIKALIFSTELNPVVSIRAKKLQLECKQNLEDKANAVIEFSTQFSIPLTQIAFVGNDINDIPALKLVGLPIAVNDAYAEVFPYVKIKTEKCGGYGAVREICDLIYHIKTTKEIK